MYRGHMATGLGSHTGKQSTRHEASDTPMKVFLSLVCWGEVVVTCLRFGHIHLSHTVTQWLPTHCLCVPCNVQLTVRHILPDCPRYTDSHQRFYLQSTIRDTGRQPSYSNATFSLIACCWHLLAFMTFYRNIVPCCCVTALCMESQKQQGRSNSYYIHICFLAFSLLSNLFWMCLL
jgi:hypothetical protein